MKVNDLLEGWEKDLADANKAKAKLAKIAAGSNKQKKAAEDEVFGSDKDLFIYDYVNNIIGRVFPDGDPIDQMDKWMDKYKITMPMIDKAFKKFTKMTMYGYMKDMWDGTAEDHVHDAKAAIKAGKKPEESVFIKIDGDKVTAVKSPY